MGLSALLPVRLSFHTERRSRRRQQTGSGGLSCLRLEEEEEEAVTVEWREGLVFPPVAWKAPFLQTTFRLAFLFLQHDHEDEKNKHYFGKNNTLSPEPMVNIKADLDLHETDYLHFPIHNSYFPINISKRKFHSELGPGRKLAMILAESYFWEFDIGGQCPLENRLKTKIARCQ